MNRKVLASAIAATLLIGGCTDDGEDGAAGLPGIDGAPGQNGVNGVSNFVSRPDVIATNANIAYAMYSDSLITAQNLKLALEELVAAPTDASFAAAKKAWLDSREPYGQSEVYRFRHFVVITFSPVKITEFLSVISN